LFRKSSEQTESSETELVEAAMNTSSLLWGLLFGSFGLGFFVYGRKQKAIIPLVCGLILMVYPYFISNTIILVILGVVLTGIPYFIRI